MSKILYEKPSTELLVVRFEEGILTVSNPNNTIQDATIDTWGDEL